MSFGLWSVLGAGLLPNPYASMKVWPILGFGEIASTIVFGELLCTCDLNALPEIRRALLPFLAVFDVVVDAGTEHQVGNVEDQQQDPSFG